ncbi:DUF3768 domain-containing protein [Mesorhizobium sp. PUT5]|uniref:DUF3768 domain-containing protein n=1 Tax=Mesorhizobium sp. PUT5 TaxID=3454629 RepID=UPI003FA45DF7
MTTSQTSPPARPRPTIAELNDAFRSSFLFGQILLTPGIASLPGPDRAAIIAKVQSFDAFGPDNDPYGEHDFGSFDQAGVKVFWKIDYYNLSMTGGSEDPADVKKTRRVLTIMLAREY